jgi:spermidine synthase
MLRDAGDELSLDFDNGTVQSRMSRAEPTRLLLEYTRLMMGFLLFQPQPARIAMIGLGGGSLAKYCGRRLPDSDFTAIEISPAVLELGGVFAIPPLGPRFHVLCDNGADYVRRAGPPLDVLLVDGFDRDGQPPDLCSSAFYDACRSRLADGGVLCVNLHRDEPSCQTWIDRIGTAFAGQMVLVEADASDNTIAFAAEAPFPPHFHTLVERLRQLEAAHPVALATTLRKITQYRPRRAANAPRSRVSAGKRPRS